MAILTIRGLDDRVKARLRVRAARNGKSMEAEARDILAAAVMTEPTGHRGLGTRIQRRFADLEDDFAIEIPPRAEEPRAADFGA